MSVNGIDGTILPSVHGWQAPSATRLPFQIVSRYVIFVLLRDKTYTPEGSYCVHVHGHEKQFVGADRQIARDEARLLSR